MGQYFKAVLIDNQHMIHVMDSWTYSCGAKQTEHCYLHNPFCRAVMHVIEGYGIEGIRLGWIGDYADENCDGEKAYHNFGVAVTMYCAAWEAYTSNEEESIFKMSSVPIPEKRFPYYVENIDRGEYVEITDDPEYGDIHPVPLLCAFGGSGGGDYYGTCMDMVGRWCGDKVRISYTRPACKELEVKFREGEE